MRVIRFDEFVREDEQIEWLVDDLLPNVGWTLFYGLRGIGKSTFALQLCDSLQRGTQFMGRKVQRTPVLYVQADSITAEWRAMVSRIMPDGNDGFTVVDVPAQALSNPSYVERLSNYVQVFRPGFVVFDSLYKLTRESINSEKVQSTINTMLDITQGRPWLLIHHPPHGESRAAGHHSLGSTCSNEWCLLRSKLKIEKGRLVGGKEILLSKDAQGLWQEYQAQRQAVGGLYERRVR